MSEEKGIGRERERERERERVIPFAQTSYSLPSPHKGSLFGKYTNTIITTMITKLKVIIWYNKLYCQ